MQLDVLTSISKHQERKPPGIVSRIKLKKFILCYLNNRKKTIKWYKNESSSKNDEVLDSSFHS
jgi:hypothetical protein